uniref:Uncharacterized protein n=1 Tax=Caenorhabditis japonica TaxID=281687 RepID=A0A8R1EE25_CAEJA
MVTQWRRHSNALRPLTNAYHRHSSGPSPADALSHRTIAARRGRQPRTTALHIQDRTVSRQPINATQPTNQRKPSRRSPPIQPTI